jgi:hypothetical protein
MYKKVYCQAVTSRFNMDVSVTCSFCGEAQKDESHLFVSCPFKYPVWDQALSRLAPYLHFNEENVKYIIFSCQRFDLINNQLLFVLCSCILRHIWQAHWRYIFDRVPFNCDLGVERSFSSYYMLISNISKHTSTLDVWLH